MSTEQPTSDTKPVLIAYATQYGSTQDVAESIAAKLRDAGISTDLLPAREVRGVSAYRAVVLGAPFYLGSWHKDARAFLEAHRQVLGTMPVALFALGPINDDEGELTEAKEQLDTELERHPWVQPIAAEMFGGKYDPSHLSFTHRLLTLLPASPLHGLDARDQRDWHAIDAWAGELSEALRPEQQR